MASLLEVWTDPGVNRAEKMLSTSIGPDLDNDENEIEIFEVKNVEGE